MWLRLAISVVCISTVSASCATKEFMPCVVQLNTQRVHFDTNILHVLYNITTEAKLIHTCRVYEKAFSCFAQRLASCGTKAQRSMFERGKRLHTYLCAPFSMQRQKIFLRQSRCIQDALQIPVDSKCTKPPGLVSQKLHSCRSKCGDDQMCNTKVDISELAVCTSLEIEKKCGPEAGQFYSQMQQVITNREFPIQCQYTLRGPTTPATRRTEATTRIPLLTKENKKTMTTPFYYGTSYITVYPEGQLARNAVSRKQPQELRIRMLGQENSSSTTTSTTITTPTTATLKTTTPLPISAAPLEPTPTVFQSFPGARPIPESFVFVQTTANPRLAVSSPPKFSAHPVSSKDSKWIPWYLANKQAGSSPTNPMIAPFMDKSTHPTLVPTLLSNDVPEETTSKPSFNFVFRHEPTPDPFKININWMDQQEDVPWYQKNAKLEETSTEANPFQVVAPFINQLKTHQLNLTEMGSKASNYFTAALTAWESVAEEAQSATADNNPWRSLIDAVAPTIQKVSPDIIPRIRQEMERLESGQ